MIKTKPDLNALDDSSSKAPWQTPLLKHESSDSGALKIAVSPAESITNGTIGPAS